MDKLDSMPVDPCTLWRTVTAANLEDKQEQGDGEEKHGTSTDFLLLSLLCDALGKEHSVTHRSRKFSFPS